MYVSTQIHWTQDREVLSPHGTPQSVYDRDGYTHYVTRSAHGPRWGLEDKSDRLNDNWRMIWTENETGLDWTR
jgi:hypothetical protein